MLEVAHTLTVASNMTNAASSGAMLVMGAFLFLMILTFVPAVVRVRQLP